MNGITRLTGLFGAVAVLAFAGTGNAGDRTAQSDSPMDWPIHDMNRPLPPVVTPGPAGAQVPPPSDAIVLLAGGELSGWEEDSGMPARWTPGDGYVEVADKTGSIRTRRGFGDCQLHVEWASPAVVKGEGQDRGNSGVFLMGLYEVQVLDGFGNRTYADGATAAIYGQYPPLVNACRKPGEWQTYDIVFHRPRFDKKGDSQMPARMTVFHNGVLVHDNAVLVGPTSDKVRPPYKAHADRLPIGLQNHGCPVRYRNIWVRDLEGKD
jgi:hypothetical protein